MRATNYDVTKVEFLVHGFMYGFNLMYQGLVERADTSHNLPFFVGNASDMWSKIMKEVRIGRYAGPFNTPLYQSFVQSPVGLVPKKGGKTCMIFHLSYNFKSGNQSVNACTPDYCCTVQYNDLDMAICNCLRLIKEAAPKPVNLYLSKSDLVSAFRALLILPSQCWLLIFKVNHPSTHKTYYFLDKNLPFGHSISCKLFQEFSNSLKHILEVMSGQKFVCTNYLDDYIFVQTTKQDCNKLVSEFLNICQAIKFPVSLEKSEWASLRMEFLGMLLDGEFKIIVVPQDKQIKAIKMLEYFVDKKKATVKELQSLAGFLNFLTKAIVPGCTFLRRMYTKFPGALTSQPIQVKDAILKKYHHVKIDEEFRNDCKIWLYFLQENDTVCRPFADFSRAISAKKIQFASDASKNPHLGFGCVYKSNWTFAQWEPGYIRKYNPSIAYLELYALCVAMLIWGHHLANGRFIIWCDNKSTCTMVNSGASSCCNCMFLLRTLAVDTIIESLQTMSLCILISCQMLCQGSI